MNVKVRGGYEYFISFIDDYSRYGHIYLIHHKSNSLEKFKEYKAEVENELGKTIKILRSDRGEEYMDLRFQDYMIENGIQSQLSAPSTPTEPCIRKKKPDLVRHGSLYDEFFSDARFFLGICFRNSCLYFE